MAAGEEGADERFGERRARAHVAGRVEQRISGTSRSRRRRRPARAARPRRSDPRRESRPRAACGSKTVLVDADRDRFARPADDHDRSVARDRGRRRRRRRDPSVCRAISPRPSWLSCGSHTTSPCVVTTMMASVVTTGGCSIWPPPTVTRQSTLIGARGKAPWLDRHGGRRRERWGRGLPIARRRP